jgi:hypothetical protein
MCRLHLKSEVRIRHIYLENITMCVVAEDAWVRIIHIYLEISEMVVLINAYALVSYI